VSKIVFRGTNKVKQVNLRRKSDKNFFRKVLEVSIEASGRNSFQREMNDSKPSYLRDPCRRYMESVSILRSSRN
jgi:hypothetical protein